ncbi:hypothetical protein RRG08_034057 [Elysia crispata]|uniref:Protein kinase C-binding protein 1 n=1 Tax=Elysia crispata TaxID=231223 RepID=A0AAE1D0Y1_9GAST|nr:hypothetical protein RRG08_034057 [Elysia crispata]
MSEDKTDRTMRMSRHTRRSNASNEEEPLEQQNASKLRKASEASSSQSQELNKTSVPSEEMKDVKAKSDSADTKGIRTRLSTGTLIMFGTSTTSLAALEDKVDSPLSSSDSASVAYRKRKHPGDEEEDGDSDGSSEPLPPKRKKIGRNDGTGEDNKNDYFCWLCHKEGLVVCCDLCPRVYHIKCLGRSDEPAKDWVCPECEFILKAECVETRSKVLSMVSFTTFCTLLRYALDRMRNVGNEAFELPVDLSLFPNYTDYVFNPMSLSVLEKNIKKKAYGSTEALLADAKWIYHNAYVYNGATNKITTAARSVVKVCKHEMSEIEVCPDCYLQSCTQTDPNWFCEPCRTPHPLVWAKLKGYPFWPAKILRAENGNVDVRFFGAHDRSWVPESSCFLLSETYPVAQKKSRAGMDLSMKELNLHIQRWRQKFGSFEYAAPRIVYSKESVTKHFRRMNLSLDGVANFAQNNDYSQNSEAKKTTVRTTDAKAVEKQSVASKKAMAVKSKYNSLTSKKISPKLPGFPIVLPPAVASAGSKYSNVQPSSGPQQRQVIYLKPMQKGVFLLSEQTVEPLPELKSTSGKLPRPNLPDLKLIKRIADKITPASAMSGSDTEISDSEQHERLSSKDTNGNNSIDSKSADSADKDKRDGVATASMELGEENSTERNASPEEGKAQAGSCKEDSVPLAGVEGNATSQPDEVVLTDSASGDPISKLSTDMDTVPSSSQKHSSSGESVNESGKAVKLNGPKIPNSETLPNSESKDPISVNSVREKKEKFLVETETGVGKSTGSEKEQSDQFNRKVEEGVSGHAAEPNSSSGTLKLPAHKDNICEKDNQNSHTSGSSLEETRRAETGSSSNDQQIICSISATDNHTNNSTSTGDNDNRVVTQTSTGESEAQNDDETDSCSQDINMNCTNSEAAPLQRGLEKDNSRKVSYCNMKQENVAGISDCRHQSSKQGKDSKPAASYSQPIEEKLKSQSLGESQGKTIHVIQAVEEKEEGDGTTLLSTGAMTTSTSSILSTTATPPTPSLLSKTIITSTQSLMASTSSLPLLSTKITSSSSSSSSSSPLSSLVASSTSSISFSTVTVTSSPSAVLTPLSPSPSAAVTLSVESPLIISVSQSLHTGVESSSPASLYKQGLQKTIDSCKAKLGLDSSSLENNDDDDAFMLGLGDDGEDEVDSDALLMDIDEEVDDDADVKDVDMVENTPNLSLDAATTILSLPSVKSSLSSSLQTTSLLTDAKVSTKATTSSSSPSVPDCAPTMQASKSRLESHEQVETTSGHKEGQKDAVDCGQSLNQHLDDSQQTNSSASKSTIDPDQMSTKDKETGNISSLSTKTEVEGGNNDPTKTSPGLVSAETHKTVTASVDSTDEEMAVDNDKGIEPVRSKPSTNTAEIIDNHPQKKANGNESRKVPTNGEEEMADEPLITSTDPPPIITIDDENSSDEDNAYSDNDENSSRDEGDCVSLDMEVACEDAMRDSDPCEEDDDRLSKQSDPAAVAVSSSSQKVTQSFPNLRHTLNMTGSSVAVNSTDVSSEKLNLARSPIRPQNTSSCSFSSPSTITATSSITACTASSSAVTGSIPLPISANSSSTAKSHLISALTSAVTRSSAPSCVTNPSLSRNLPPSLYLHSVVPASSPSPRPLSTPVSAPAQARVALSLPSFPPLVIQPSTSGCSTPRKQVHQPRKDAGTEFISGNSVGTVSSAPTATVSGSSTVTMSLGSLANRSKGKSSTNAQASEWSASMAESLITNVNFSSQRNTRDSSSESSFSERLRPVLQKGLKKVVESLSSCFEELSKEIQQVSVQTAGDKDIDEASVLAMLEEQKKVYSNKMRDVWQFTYTSQKESQENYVKQKELLEEKLATEFDQLLKKRIEETKRHQWCAECLKEAVYYCCWNTSYCSYQCQQKHWPAHMPKCMQAVSSSAVSQPVSTSALISTLNGPSNNIQNSNSNKISNNNSSSSSSTNIRIDSVIGSYFGEDTGQFKKLTISKTPTSQTLSKRVNVGSTGLQASTVTFAPNQPLQFQYLPHSGTTQPVIMASTPAGSSLLPPISQVPQQIQLLPTATSGRVLPLMRQQTTQQMPGMASVGGVGATQVKLAQGLGGQQQTSAGTQQPQQFILQNSFGFGMLGQGRPL